MNSDALTVSATVWKFFLCCVRKKAVKYKSRSCQLTQLSATSTELRHWKMRDQIPEVKMDRFSIPHFQVFVIFISARACYDKASSLVGWFVRCDFSKIQVRFSRNLAQMFRICAKFLTANFCEIKVKVRGYRGGLPTTVQA